MPSKRVLLLSQAPDEIVESLREEIHQRRGEWTAIANASNGKLNHRWLGSFSRGETVMPRFDAIRRLAEILGRKLVVKKSKPLI